FPPGSPAAQRDADRVAWIFCLQIARRSPRLHAAPLPAGEFDFSAAGASAPGAVTVHPLPALWREPNPESVSAATEEAPDGNVSWYGRDGVRARLFCGPARQSGEVERRLAQGRIRAACADGARPALQP